MQAKRKTTDTENKLLTALIRLYNSVISAHKAATRNLFRGVFSPVLLPPSLFPSLPFLSPLSLSSSGPSNPAKGFMKALLAP